jgi:hypothetical protein
MTLAEILIVLSTALSPLIAVQVTRRLDDRNEKTGRKLQVFKTLMATRAYTLSPSHVEALNRIELEFSSRNSKEKDVIEIWQQYLDHLGSSQDDFRAWGVRRIDLFVDLMYAMGRSLGYDFSKTQIKNGTYLPTAHTQTEDEQHRIRRLVLEVLEGKRDFPMRVTNLPVASAPSDTHPN